MKSALITIFLLILIALGFLAGQYLSHDKQQSAHDVRLLGKSFDCLLSEGPCQVAGYTLEFKDRPIRPLTPIRVEMQAAANVSSVVLDLEMIDMDMGVNRFRLSQDAGGIWKGEIMIPVCATGRRDWIANMLIESEQGAGKVVYSFVVQ